jgi:hypothetical protein
MDALGGTAVRLAYFFATSENPCLKMNGKILVPNVSITSIEEANNFVGWG